MARQMSPDEYRVFMSIGTRTGKLATTREGGRPHVAPVWFLLDGDDIVFTTHERSVKGKNLSRDPRAMLGVDEEVPPYAYALVEGTVTISKDLDELRRWATRLGGRYMGEDQAEAFGARNGVPGELLIRLSPTKVLAYAAIAE